MTFPKVRPVVFAILFLSWLGYLLFLVIETNTTIISRPQFEISQAVVVATVRDNGEGTAVPTVMVKEVLWCEKGLAVGGKELHLIDLLACKKDHGYDGAGDYVIPLVRRGVNWQIATIPTPGVKRPHPSHGTLEIRHVGSDPECVKARFADYALRKPHESEGLMKGLQPAVAPGPLPVRLPIADAKALAESLKECGAEVNVSAEEVRIYRWSEPVREQVDEVIAAK